MSNLTKLLIGVSVLVLLIFGFTGCERIDAGHVGVKVNLYGDGKGVDSYTADALISNRQEFEIKVRQVLEKQLSPEGFVLQQFTSNLVYPETFKKAIEAKNNAVQSALMAENQVKTAEAQARIKIATAEGNAQALLTNARAEAESNKLRQQTLTPLLLQQMWIEKWEGNVPSTVLGSNQNLMFGLNK